MGSDSAWPGAKPGRYARLSVEDTGCGMPDDVRVRIFEPFFTTKGVGAGTGLGLSTAFGIVEQSGGHIEVASEPGRGTRFHVFLPASADAPAAGGRVPAKSVLPSGRETILLVEDERAVRDLTAMVLRKAGYAVVEAGGAEEAIQVHAAAVPPVDLLLTDVVMAGPSGRELAEELGGVAPGLDVIYMSGYPDDAVLRHGLTSSDVEFLHKPFTREALLQKVRGVLDRSRNVRPAAAQARQVLA
ncbi:ATP-binding protein [Limnoglobus roseus]|uniref:histidine kinase n=1 Tax=Limnoglobus roseus TaxID=2598579 RepID=A0A5C1ALQ1_9BACT|nr:ATP-binding protein [Limnoglobus roseus]QEL18906.1 putative histidine kinase [Limnoglobus roseus]